MEQTLIINNFISTQLFGVFSSNGSEGFPESAVVAFSTTESLEIIFFTEESTRKYKNILKDNKVSFVIGWEKDKFTTVQIEGIATEIDQNELEVYKRNHAAKHPHSAKYMDLPEERFIKIKPTWIRYSDLSKDPEEIFEIRF